MNRARCQKSALSFGPPICAAGGCRAFFKPVPAFCKGVSARVMNSDAAHAEKFHAMARVINRELPTELPADRWFHLAPFGEFRKTMIVGDDQEKPCIQVFDRETFGRMDRHFRRTAAAPEFRGLLLDYDHLSWQEAGRTEAAGRIMDLQIRGDGTKPEHGAWVRIDFTPPGEAAVRNRTYSFLSISAAADEEPELGADKLPRIRPVVLTDAALTNRPALPVRAMNREVPGTKPAPSGKPAEEANQERVKMLKQIALALGLAEDATEEAILAKIKAMSETAAQLPQVQNRLRDLETAALRKEAEAFVEQHAARVTNRQLVVEQYMAAPDQTKKLFAALAPAAPPARVLNDGKTPAHPEQPRVQNRGKLQDEATRQIMRVRNIADYGQAQQMARTEKPDLFETETK